MGGWFVPWGGETLAEEKVSCFHWIVPCGLEAWAWDKRTYRLEAFGRYMAVKSFNYRGVLLL